MFSRQKNHFHKTLCGAWPVVYLWAQTRYIFYELGQGEDGGLLDTADDVSQNDSDDLARLYGRSPQRL
ncbi:hypothetical protein ACQKWADRAFT_301331 [Trichoderma austrokoningii]